MEGNNKKHNVRKAEFIDELPENTIPIRNYESCCYGTFEFDRYWYDRINHRIIMKPKHMKKYKIETLSDIIGGVL